LDQVLARKRRSALEILVARVMLVKTPSELLSRINKRVKRLSFPRRLRKLWWSIRMGANDGVCSVEINTQIGFFGHMTWCLWILRYCELHGLIPDIRLTGKNYLDPDRGPNWLHYYFDVSTPISARELASRARYTQKVFDWEDMPHLIDMHMTIDEGARILHRYLPPKAHVVKMVDEFWKTLGAEGKVVGVHFRGTDKSWEAPRVPWEHCLSVVERYVRNHPAVRAVFVASDEHDFIEFMKNSLKDVPVYSHDDHHRSTSEQPIHAKTGGGGYERGEDALVNALLLAKCSVLIRTTSSLSGWASVFNPDLQVILLNIPYDTALWYPENEVIKQTGTKYELADALGV